MVSQRKLESEFEKKDDLDVESGSEQRFMKILIASVGALGHLNPLLAAAMSIGRPSEDN
jgi:hypothetical protein